MKIQDYCTSEKVVIIIDWNDSLTIPEMTFVKPIEIRWVPKHVVENPRWQSFNPDKDVFCYCHYGIIPIPRSKVRKI